MLNNPYQAVANLEYDLARYTGARYAVTTNSCTMALTLAVAWHLQPNHPGALLTSYGNIEIPKRTYVSVPMSIIHAGGRPTFRDEDWLGKYQLRPLPVWDSARLFTWGMHVAGQMECVSFHASKTLGDTQGGAILLDDPDANQWLRRARFDGRTELVHPTKDRFDMVGFHCYLSADVAARLHLKLYSLPRDNAPLKNDDYPDLSTLEIFK